jgi:hypothetical protein
MQLHRASIDGRIAMATKHVRSDALNLRREPKVQEGNVLGVLIKGQAVNVLGPSGTEGWVEAEATVDSVQRRGFVAGHLLRGPASAAKERLMSNAVAEWVRFDRGEGLEHVDPFFRFVGEMWQAIGENLDGRDRDQPWSAAFISWIVRRAGAEYAAFRFAASHSRYIHDSIKKREAGTPSPFWGFRLREHRVSLGDLVCQWRIDPQTFDGARSSDSFFSHCDVVVEVTPGSVRTLGGNVDHTVGFKTYAVNADGFLKAENKVFAVLRNNV